MTSKLRSEPLRLVSKWGLFLLLCAGTALAGPKSSRDNPEGRAWIQRAQDKFQLRAQDSPSFRLLLDLRLPEMRSSTQRASYSLAWLDSENWAESLVLPTHQWQRGAEAGEAWQVESGEKSDDLAATVEMLLQPAELLGRQLAGGLMSAPRSAAMDASRTEVTVRFKRDGERVLQFDSETGALVSYADSKGRLFEYGQAMEIGAAFLPARMSYLLDGALVVKATLRNMRPLREAALGEFARPGGAIPPRR